MNYTTGALLNRRGRPGKNRWKKNQTTFFHTVREGVKQAPKKNLNSLSRVQNINGLINEPNDSVFEVNDPITESIRDRNSLLANHEIRMGRRSNVLQHSEEPCRGPRLQRSQGQSISTERGPSVVELLDRLVPKYVPSMLFQSETKTRNSSESAGPPSFVGVFGTTGTESRNAKADSRSTWKSVREQKSFSFVESRSNATDWFTEPNGEMGGFFVNSSYKEKRSFSFVLETKRLNMDGGNNLTENNFFEQPTCSTFNVLDDQPMRFLSPQEVEDEEEVQTKFPTNLTAFEMDDGVFKRPRLSAAKNKINFPAEGIRGKEALSFGRATKSSCDSFFATDTSSGCRPEPKPFCASVSASGSREAPPPNFYYRNLFKTPKKCSTETSKSYSRYDDLFKTPQTTPNFYTSLPPPLPFLHDEPDGEDFDVEDKHNEDNRRSASGKAHKKRNMPTSHMKHKSVPSTSKSSRSTNDYYIVIAITEGIGYATGEVGLAAMDLQRPVLILSQMSDSQMYTKTLAKINVINPAEMLVPHTYEKLKSSSNLFRTVSEKFSDMKIVAVNRQYFSSQDGQQNIKNLCLPEYSAVEHVVHRKYYALAAMAALIKYLEFEHNIVFSSKSIRIDFLSPEDIVAIDTETALKLELVISNSNEPSIEKNSLMEVLNHCRTLGGKRKLRMDLLQPPSKSSVIYSRLETVEFLVQEPLILKTLQDVLCKFSDVERLLWLCKKVPDFKSEKKTSELLTNYVLLLKGTLETLPQLQDVLSEANYDYFANVRDELCDGRFNQMKIQIDETINEDSKLAKGHAASELQRCYAIKDGVNGLLDVARSIYSELIGKIQEVVEELGQRHAYVLKMSQSHDQGFHVQLVIPKGKEIDESQLPQEFTEIKRCGRTIRFTTYAIYMLNMRVLRCLQEIHLISNVILYELVQDLRMNIACLYRLCEHVAQLDLLASLAQMSTSSGYTKPSFGEVLNIMGARHPILEQVNPSTPTPNDVFASSLKNFNIVTGPNMAGKTVYVLLIPLLQIMAQIGCFVPADSAEFKIINHIFVKKGIGDCLETGLSSFKKEVNEMAYALNNMHPNSLIIIDELCQGTNNDLGTAVAWAFCEEFLQRPAFTFLTTHLFYITNLSKIFSNVTNYHLEAIEQEGVDCGKLTFTYRLLSGISPIEDYGVRLMQMTDLPTEMKLRAIAASDRIRKERAASLPVAKAIRPTILKEIAKIERLESFMNNLYQMVMRDQLTEEILSTLQRMIVEEILPCEDDELSTHSTTDSQQMVDMESLASMSKEGSVKESDVASVLFTGNRDKQNQSSGREYNIFPSLQEASCSHESPI